MKINSIYRIGWGIVLILSFVPVLLWVMAAPVLPRLSTAANALVSIAQIFGLVGSSMFALNLVLSARLRWIEQLFNGLHRVYLKHSHLGQYAFILLLFHPLLLLWQYSGGSFYGAATFLLPSHSWPLNFGIFALGSMIILIVLTLYLRPKYHLWKWTHKFFGLAFFLASLHIWLIPSDTSRYMPLRVYILGLSFFGIVAFTYRTLFGRFFVKTVQYIVSDVAFPNEFVTQISMKPNGNMMSFTPGQFIFVSFADSALGTETHPFSIVSHPADHYIAIAAKKLGDYTEKLSAIPLGTIATIEGPYGAFSFQRATYTKQIWIAGGIGITPFISMVKELNQESEYSVDLYYCVKNEQEAVYIEQLQEIADSLHNSFRVVLFCSDKQGYIDANYIEKTSGDFDNTSILLCAPPVMIQSLKKQLIEKRVPAQQLYSEEFSL